MPSCLATLACALALAAPGTNARVDQRPNVVLLVADDMDYEHFGFAGHPRAQTPTRRSMAAYLGAGT